MKQTLRLELYQETACYKKPMAFKVGETYPLPPYSTVKGMLHSLIDTTSFIPMRLSVQGNYDCQLVDYQTHYFFKKKDVNEFPIVLDGTSCNYEFTNMTKMPLYTHLLYNVFLLIHVEADEEIIQKIIAAIENGKSLSLGRWEDLVRIENYQIVEVKEEKIRKNNFPAFVPVTSIHRRISYIPYHLNWKYEIKNGVRTWEKIKTGYVQKGQHFMEGPVDEKGDAIFYHQ